MPLDVQDNFTRVKNAIAGSTAKSEVQMDHVASTIGNRFMREIWAVQPVGGPDPMPGRNTRPSERQGNRPIERGWLDSPRIRKEGPGTRTIEIVSESPHVTFFTEWAGRPYLGTQPGNDIVAVNARTLAFWWMGSARFPVRVPGKNRKGFTPASDFMQMAFARTEPFIWEQIKGLAGFALDEQFRDLA